MYNIIKLLLLNKVYHKIKKHQSNVKLPTSFTSNRVRIIRPRIISSSVTCPSIHNILIGRSNNNESEIKSKSASMAEINTLHKNNSNIHNINVNLMSGKCTDKDTKVKSDDMNLKKTFLSSFDISWNNSLDSVISFISEILGEETPVKNVLDDTFNISYDIISAGIDKVKDLSESMISSRTNFTDNGSQTERISKIHIVQERKKSMDAGTQTSQKIHQDNRKRSVGQKKKISNDYVSTIDLSNERSWPLKKNE
uniref:CUE domain-containing protein n=1 Tax=Strongyloides venezuelensis TaxID=75913 RepID=A0A0K0FM05_STRVS